MLCSQLRWADFFVRTMIQKKYDFSHAGLSSLLRSSPRATGWTQLCCGGRARPGPARWRCSTRRAAGLPSARRTAGPRSRWGLWRAPGAPPPRRPLRRAERGSRPSARLWHLIGWLGQATGNSQSGVELRRLCSPQSLRRRLRPLGAGAEGQRTGRGGPGLLPSPLKCEKINLSS